MSIIEYNGIDVKKKQERAISRKGDIERDKKV